MAQAPAQDHTTLKQIVKDNLHEAQKHIAGLRKTNTWLLITGIVSGAATTLVAGGTAAVGPVVREGPAGWRLACIVAAVFAFASTVCTALSEQLKIGEKLIQSTQYAGRLRALDAAITTGSKSWEEITQEYSEIVQIYPELGG